MTRLHRNLGVIVTSFMFFPYIGFIPDIDMQPSFILVFLAALFLTLVTRKASLNRVDLYLILTLYFSLFARLMIQFINGALNEGWAASFLTTGFHITVFLICMIVIRLKMVVESGKSLLIIISIYALVGSIQLFDESFLSSLVDRGYQELRATGRGVKSLVSEPAVFGHMLTVLNLYYVFVSLILEKRGMFIVCLISGILLFLNAILAQSAYSVFFHFCFFVSLLLCGYRVVAVLLFAIPGFLFFYFLDSWQDLFAIDLFSNSDARLFQIMQTALLNPVQLYEQGAFLRLMNIPISLQGVLEYGVFGSGFAPSQIAKGSLLVFDNSPYMYQVGDRNMGGSVELILRMGILSIPFFLFFLRGLMIIWRTLSVTLNISPRLRLLFVFWIWFLTFSYSSPGNPVIWLLFWSVVINSMRMVKKGGGVYA